MRRRDFIAGFGGTAVWLFAVRAPQSDRMLRIGVLQIPAADDPEARAHAAVLLRGLAGFGWTDGRNVRMKYRRARNTDNIRKYAVELAALAIGGASLVGPLLQATRTVPIVFTYVADPVAAGFTDSLARPGGNATGLTSFKYSTSGKWLQLLKQIAPSVTRVAVLRTSDIATGPAEFGIIQATAQSLR